MANGITVTPNPDPAQLQGLGVTRWPTWGCGVSTFPWTYDEQEICLLLEGDAKVTPDGSEPVRFGAGDLVVFDAGLSCTWEVHAPVRKHCRFARALPTEWRPCKSRPLPPPREHRGDGAKHRPGDQGDPCSSGQQP